MFMLWAVYYILKEKPCFVTISCLFESCDYVFLAIGMYAAILYYGMNMGCCSYCLCVGIVVVYYIIVVYCSSISL